MKRVRKGQPLFQFDRRVSGSTSTAVTRVGWGSRGMSWIVCWITRASVEYGVTKRRPMRKISRTWRPMKAETTAHAMLAWIRLNRKKTSQTRKT